MRSFRDEYTNSRYHPNYPHLYRGRSLSNSDKFYAVYGAVTERFYSRKTAFFLSAWELPQQDWDQRLAPFPDFSGAAFSGDLPPVRSPSSLLEILYRIRADLSRVSVKIIKKYAEGRSYTLFTKNSIKTFDICFILCYNISLQYYNRRNTGIL